MLSRQSAKGALTTIAGAIAMILAVTAAEAAMTPVGDYLTSSVQLAAGNACGAGQQMGANGVCHSDAWFTRRRLCPPGMHAGPYRRRCLPN